MVGSESNRIRRAEKQSERRDPMFFALVSAFFFPSSIFYPRFERLEQAKQNEKKNNNNNNNKT